MKRLFSVLLASLITTPAFALSLDGVRVGGYGSSSAISVPTIQYNNRAYSEFYALNDDTINLYFYFDTDGLQLTDASLTFDFIDLDLIGGNDPSTSYEFARFYIGAPIHSETISSLNHTESGILVSGNFNTQSITFNNISSYINSIIHDGSPLVVRMEVAGVNIDNINSPEYVAGQLTATEVPEPASLLLLGSGLIGLTGLCKRTAKKIS